MLVVASSPAQHFFTIFGAAIAGFGLIFVLVGLIIRRASRLRGGTRTRGTIVGFDARTTGSMQIPGSEIGVTGVTGMGPGVVYRPTVQFTTADGTQVTATSRSAQTPARGTRVTLSRSSTTPATPGASGSFRTPPPAPASSSHSCWSAAPWRRSGSSS